MGVKLCDNFKCPVQKKPYPPGKHGKTRRKRRRTALSEYGVQLAAKQKAKRIYGIRERQFGRYFKDSTSIDRALRTLEMRLDNVVFRLGFARTRFMAKQLITHGHIIVDGKKVNIPSFQTRPRQVIGIREKSKSTPLFKDLSVTLKKYETLSWLSLDSKNLEGKIINMPSSGEIGLLAEGALIGEFYSR